ncbi:MAG: queuosine salvage family protein [Candidatus Thorarchaeota archaeon]
MNLVKSVYEIAEDFMKTPNEVEVNYEGIEKVGNEMLNAGPMDFPYKTTEDQFKDVLLELVASSINYCYWYGSSNIRPNGASSTFLYEHIANAFFDYSGTPARQETGFNICLTRLINLLITNRFPLSEERMYHLNQLRLAGEKYVSDIITDYKETGNINDAMLSLITLFPGFGSDIFLKRAILFFMQLNRRFGWFSEGMKTLPVAADYQVPKLLEHLGCITYCPELKKRISFNKLIPKNSIEECEIRAATIIACRELCKLTGWNIAQVDGYLWLKRKEVTTPFHLTITTDY